MASQTESKLPNLVKQHESAVLQDWMKEQVAASSYRADLMTEADLRSESTEFLRAFRDALQSGELRNVESGSWRNARELITNLSRSRAAAGFTPSETATFVLSLKQPLFAVLRKELGSTEQFADELWTITSLLDKLALMTSDIFIRTREEVIRRQQEEMLELSTPVVKLWDGVLALPMIGTLDSARTQVVMETLLQRIVETGSEVAIIDITGVPQVDTLVAQHLLKTVTAARLMGAECIISGIRPQIAQTIVHLGVDLGNITTKATLADAFRVALGKTGRTVARMGTYADGGNVSPGNPRQDGQGLTPQGRGYHPGLSANA